MKRLWVRLSLMISGVLFLMFFMQFLVITLEQNGSRPDLEVKEEKVFFLASFAPLASFA